MEFYRYEAVEYAEQDYDGEYTTPTIPNPKLELRTFVVKRETPKGYWVGYERYDTFKKFVRKDSKKKFAYLTKEEALNNFILRTKRRIQILKYQLSSCESALSRAENFKIQ